MSYSGNVALVTGAGSGMGQLAARIFARTGAAVAALDVNEAGLAKTAEGQENVHIFNADVTDFDGLKAVVEEIETKCGPIDRVYHAAAIMPLGKILDMDQRPKGGSGGSHGDLPVDRRRGNEVIDDQIQPKAW